MTNNIVTDEQFRRFSKRVRDMERRVLYDGSVPFQFAMGGVQAIIEHDRERLIKLTGPIYPKGTIVLSLDIDLSLSLEDMIRRGKYTNEESALREITEKRYPINREVPELQYSTTILLVPPYREEINFKDQEAEMKINRLRQLGVVETLAIGEQYPHLQFGYYIIGLGSTWPDSDGTLDSPALWLYDGERELFLGWRSPELQLSGRDRCIAAPQAVA
jgi:hypothetical protein